MRRFTYRSVLLILSLVTAASSDDVEFSVGDGSGGLSLIDEGQYYTTQVLGQLQVKRDAFGVGPAIILTHTSGPEGSVYMDDSPSGMVFLVDYVTTMFISDSGKVGIGTTAPSEALEVAGNMEASGKVIADSIRVQKVYINNWSIDAPDYVFDESYPLASLEHVESYIKENKHLPDVPSGTQIKEDGIDLAEMNMVLLRKIEELTLYTLAQQKEIEELKAAVETQHANRN